MGIVWLTIAIIAVISTGLSVWSFVYHNTTILTITLAAEAIITFFGFLGLSLVKTPAGDERRFSEGGMRMAITASVVITYLTVLALVLFLYKGEEMPKLTETIVTHFTTIVGIVIAFYLGSSAYVSAKRSNNSGGSKKEKADGKPQVS